MAIKKEQSPADVLAADTQSGLQDIQATAESPELVQVASASGLKGLINTIVKEGPEGATKQKNKALETEPNIIKGGDDFVSPQDQKLLDEITEQDLKVKNLQSVEDYKIKSFESSDDIIKNLEVYSPNLKQSSSKVTQKETAEAANLEMANILNMSKKWNKDNTIFTPAQVVAAKNAVMSSTDTLKKIAQTINDGDNSTASLYLFREQMVKHAALVQTFKAGRANVARALDAFKIPSNYKGSINDFQEIVVGEFGGVTAAKMMAEHILDPDMTARKLNMYVDGTAFAKTKDGIMELYVNGLLSGPRTQLRNLIGNAFYQGLAIPETAMAASFNALETGIKKAGSYIPKLQKMNYFNTPSEGVTFSQLYARAYSYKYSVGKAWNAAALSIKKAPDSTKLETATYKRETISATNYGLDPNSYSGAGVDLFGKIIRLPGTALVWGDEFFKTMARSAEEGQMAAAYAEQLQRQGITNIDEIAEKTTEYLYTNPATKKQVDKAVLNKVFQDDLGPSMKNLSSFINSQRWLRVVIPFVRTPTNIYKAVWNYSGDRVVRGVQIPLDLILQQAGKEPGAYTKQFKNDAAFRQKEMAKFGVSSMAFMKATEMTEQGRLTGPPPRDQSAAAFWRENNIQPYSFVIGTKDVTDFDKPFFDDFGRPQPGLRYISYAGIEPFGSFFGIAATANRLTQNTDNMVTRDNIGISAGFAVADYFKEIPFLQGLATIYETIGLAHGKEPGDQLAAIEKIIKQYGQTIVPYSGLLRGFDQVFSPEKNFTGPDYEIDTDIYKLDEFGKKEFKNGQFVANPNFGSAKGGLGNNLMNDAALWYKNTIQNIPGVSNSLATKYGYDFQPIKQDHGVEGFGTRIYNMVVPFTYAKGDDLEPYELEVMRLGTPGYDGRKKSVMGIKLNDSQYSLLQKTAGEVRGKGSNKKYTFNQALKNLIERDRAYRKGDDKNKKTLLSNLRREYLNQAFVFLSEQNQEFQAINQQIKIRENLINKNRLGAYE